MRPSRNSVFALALVGLAVVAAPSQASDAPTEPEAAQTVVLLHGLARSAKSMRRMASSLESTGYAVCNIDYPSTEHAIEVLAKDHVLPTIETCAADAEQVHFVTHSMGGIIVRYLATLDTAPAIGRVVMLGPPNSGSEVVDRIGDWAAFNALNGPAGQQLGTDAESLPNQLGPATFEVGVIAGRRSINWINSTMIDGRDDGKVSVKSAQLEGMADFLILPVTHPMMMRSRRVIRETQHFLQHGKFGAKAE